MAPSNPYTTRFPRLGPSASVAQLAEQLICNQQVAGSTPAASSARPDGRRQPRGRRRPTGRDTPGPKQTRETITGTRHATRSTPAQSRPRDTNHWTPEQPTTRNHTKEITADTHPPATSQQRILPPPRASRGQPADRPSGPGQEGSFPSGQRGQTVNLMAYAFAGSNPALPIFHRGVPLLPRSVSPRLRRGEGAAGRQPRPSRGPCGHGGLAGEGPEATQTACGCSSMVEQ